MDNGEVSETQPSQFRKISTLCQASRLSRMVACHRKRQWNRGIIATAQKDLHSLLNQQNNLVCPYGHLVILLQFPTSTMTYVLS